VKALWARYAERINAATLRERAMMFAAAALVLVTVLYSMIIEPQVREQRRLSAQQVQRQAESAKLQAELQKLALSRRQDPNLEARRRIEALRGELAQLNSEIADEQKKFTAPEQMRAVLEEVLVQNRKLRLMDLKTLPPAPLSELRAQEPASGKPAAPAAEKLIYRHGLQLTLSGTYLDMLAYLTALEKLSARVYWGSMELSVVEYPTVTLKLTVYTVSLDRAWMVV
jgi:MSHA biogenesis protein MshJ